MEDAQKEGYRRDGTTHECQLGLRPSDAQGRTAAILRFPYWACVAYIEGLCISRVLASSRTQFWVDHTDANLKQKHESSPLFVLPLYHKLPQILHEMRIRYTGKSLYITPSYKLISFFSLSLSYRPIALALPWARIIIRGSRGVHPKLIFRQERLFLPSGPMTHSDLQEAPNQRNGLFETCILIANEHHMVAHIKSPELNWQLVQIQTASHPRRP
jgi:hypothetical protein